MQDFSQQIKPTLKDNIINPLLTDNYQLTMAYTYYLHNRHNKTSVFEAYFRKCPFGTKQKPGQYVIFAGLSEALSFIKYFKFTEEQLEFLRQQLPQAKEEFFQYLSELNGNQLTISSIQEGSIVFPHEPLIRIEGPLAFVQLIETPILNLLNFSSLVATNASRIKKEAGQNKSCLEFGLRRAQGPDGGLTASVYSYLGGFDGSSNVLSGMKYGIPISGTMAHSFVTSYKDLSQVSEFEVGGVKIKELALLYRSQLGLENTNEGELASFLAYAMAFPDKFLCLVDTYDVLESGIPNFLCVSFALMKAGKNPIGIRLDSGDLASQSIKGKSLYKQLGEKVGLDTSKLTVFASNDINESTLTQLNQDNHQIDGYGIGTQLVTCASHPALGMVYKLVSFEGEAKLKVVATEPEKSTLPGKKNIYRIWTENYDYPILDIICLDEQIIEVGKEVNVVNKNNHLERYTLVPVKVEKLLQDFWVKGQVNRPIMTIKEARSFSIAQKSQFNQEVLDNHNPTKYNINTLIMSSFFSVSAPLTQENQSCFPTLSYKERLMGLPYVADQDGTSFLIGFDKQIKNMKDKERLVTSIVFLTSMVMTFVSAIVLKMPLLVLVCLIVQFSSYIWYVASYIPFARSCIKSCLGKIKGKVGKSILPQSSNI